MIYQRLSVVLLAVLCLSACRGRTILSDGSGAAGGGTPRPKKKVTAMVLPKTTGPGSQDKAAQQSAASAGNEVTVWYTAVSGDKISYFPQIKKSAAPFGNQGEALSFALRELLAGPGEGGQEKLATEIPRGSVLIGVAESPGGGVVIDLSRRFVAGGGMDSFEARLEQVRRTAGGVIKDRPVFLNVEGRRLTASDDGLEIKQPICGLAPGNEATN